ncbi:MAG: S9 family peptidase [Actinobacteria bacterium]|nr:S9 family peptidase [Actinomycetota bacterium]
MSAAGRTTTGAPGFRRVSPSNDPFVPAAPAAHRVDAFDVLHGVEVRDPYRWLEDSTRPETAKWVDEQNARTREVLDALPARAALHEQLHALLRAGSSTACSVEDDRVFSLDRWGHHDQTVLVVRSAGDVDQPPRTLVDPHKLTGDPTTAIDWYSPSPGGHLVAYGISRGGDEQSTLHIIEVDSGRVLREKIPNTRAASVAWLPDGSAFAYTRYPDPASVREEDRGYWRKVFWHRIGHSWTYDDLIWSELPDRTAWPNVSLSRDGRWLLVHTSLGWSRVDVHLVDRKTGAHTVLIEGIEAVSQLTVIGDHIVGVTTLEAPRGRVVRAPLSAAWHERWETIIPEDEAVIEAVAATSRSLLVLSSHSAVSRLDRYDHDGGGHEPVPLPELGSLAGLSGNRDHDHAFFSFTSFARPASLFRWDASGVREWSRFREIDLEGDGPAGEYLVEQVRYPSTDGTSISMFVIRSSSTTPTAGTHCVLTGYGGFSITMGPAYSAAIVAVCDGGGLYAVANIRGGAEEGEAWHQAGMREHKQQSFDDFLAAADWLVEHGYTSRERLAFRGGSNGGLLVGAAITQRPDACRAVQIAVPLLDMVRYHQFLIARLWIPEYGDPDNPDEFAWLYDYSPYHRVVDGRCYPAVLLTTAEGDSRVDPMHARKMAALLQSSTACGDERPILLREETLAGHGQGKPVSQQANELADVFAFLYWQLGVETGPLASGR